MKQLTEHKNPLYGRFNREISLSQFNYLDAKKMLANLSNTDLIAFYSVFGGSPYVLQRVDQTRSLKENICELILDENGQLRTHLRNNVINELENDTDLHEILDVIKNGSKKHFFALFCNQGHFSIDLPHFAAKYCLKWSLQPLLRLSEWRVERHMDHVFRELRGWQVVPLCRGLVVPS